MLILHYNLIGLLNSEVTGISVELRTKMLLDSRRLWILVCVLSVDFLCDGSISSIPIQWE